MAHRLRRNTREAMLAGVAAGLADHLGLDPLLLRLGFIFLCLFGGSGLLLYLLCWVLMPRDVDLDRRGPEGAGGGAPAGGGADDGSTPADRMAREAGEAGQRVVDSLRRGLPEGGGRGRLILGVILMGIGLLLLADRFLPFRWFWVWDLWPLALVAAGVAMVLHGLRGEGR